MTINIYNSARSFLVSYWRGERAWDCSNLYTTIDDAVNAVRITLDNEHGADGAHIMDSDTGEIYVSCYADESNSEESNYEDWDSDYWVDRHSQDDAVSKIILTPILESMRSYTASHTSKDDDVEPGYEENWDSDYWDDGCPIDDVDESNYDPYAGCDMYEVEPFDFGGDF